MSIFSKEYTKEVVENYPLDPNRVEALRLWQVELGEINDLFNPKRPKESDLHEQFFTDVFEKALGYSKKTAGTDTYTIRSEYTTDVDASRPDGVLGFFDKGAGDDVRVVIELKSPGVDLDKRQNRGGNKQTPVDQAFSYAHKFSNVEWVIVSNYDEIRLYQRQTSKYMEKFDLADLVDKDEDRLKLFFRLLSCDNLLSKDGKSIANKLFREREEQLKSMQDGFYEKYKEVREKVASHILKKKKGEVQPAKAVSMSQTLLDRILFIAFLEDYKLLDKDFKPIERAYKSTNVFDENPQTAWENFKKLFQYMDRGNNSLGIPPYNGGLFKHNPDIEELDIDKNILEGYLKLREYNFRSDLRVRILGHVFEKSITDLDRLKFKLGDDDAKDTKRHDEGAYYTPESVTNYIVEKTIGVHLNNIKERLGIDELPDLKMQWLQWRDSLSDDKKTGTGGNYETWLKGSGSKHRNARVDFWKNYMKELQEVKIVDPSCGSGAFLVAAFEYLMKELDFANNELSRLGVKDLFTRYDRELLKNNLFGVDISEEAVEITKLSLWLQIAKNKEALPALDDNILQTDAVAGTAWDELFPHIMAEGGFDIVIGNPPYVRQELVKKIKPILEKRFESYDGRADIYVYFYELGYNILKEGGYLGYITYNKWMRRQYGMKLRQFIKEKVTLLSLMDLKDLPLFEEATTYTNIIAFRKQPHANNSEFIIKEPPFFEDTVILKQSALEKGYHLQENPLFFSLMEKVREKGTPLKEWDIKISSGIKTGYNVPFIIDDFIRDAIVKKAPKSAEIIKPILRGKDVNRWHAEWKNQWVITTAKGIDIDSYPAIKKHLAKHKTELENRAGAKKNWYELDSAISKDDFGKEKIIYPIIKKKQAFMIEKHGYCINDKAFRISGQNLPYLCAVLNSDLLHWYFLHQFPTLRGNFPEFKGDVMKQVPIPKITKAKQKPFADLSDELHALTKERHEILKRFFTLMTANLNLDKTRIKPESWYKMQPDEFMKSVKKGGNRMSVKERDEWLEHFAEQKAKIDNLDEKIATAEDKLNTLVHKLYALTAEEVEFIKKT